LQRRGRVNHSTDKSRQFIVGCTAPRCDSREGLLDAFSPFWLPWQRFRKFGNGLTDNSA
jgi:hypothetical protein